MMATELKIPATDVDLIAANDGSVLSVVGKIVELTPQGPRRTEDTIYLTLTPRQAMRLLALLQKAQAQLGLPPHPEPVSLIAVPPAKDRN